MRLLLACGVRSRKVTAWFAPPGLSLGALAESHRSPFAAPGKATLVVITGVAGPVLKWQRACPWWSVCDICCSCTILVSPIDLDNHRDGFLAGHQIGTDVCGMRARTSIECWSDSIRRELCARRLSIDGAASRATGVVYDRSYAPSWPQGDMSGMVAAVESTPSCPVLAASSSWKQFQPVSSRLTQLNDRMSMKARNAQSRPATTLRGTRAARFPTLAVLALIALAPSRTAAQPPATPPPLDLAALFDPGNLVLDENGDGVPDRLGAALVLAPEPTDAERAAAAEIAARLGFETMALDLPLRRAPRPRRPPSPRSPPPRATASWPCSPKTTPTCSARHDSSPAPCPTWAPSPAPRSPTSPTNSPPG